MSAIVTNPSAGNRYRSSAQTVREHRDLIGQQSFEKACDFAMLNYCQRVMQDARPDGNGAASGYYRILGAHEFLRELRLLAESSLPVTFKTDTDNLTEVKK